MEAPASEEGAEPASASPPAASRPVLRRRLLLSVLLTAGVGLVVAGLWAGNVDDIGAEATYGNFDQPSPYSFVHRMLPGLLDTARAQYYEFTREVHYTPLLAVGAIFVIFWLVRTLGIPAWDLRRAVVQWLVFVVTRLGVLRVAQVFPLSRCAFGSYPFLTCEACEMATAGCPIGTLQIALTRLRLPLLTAGVMVVGGALFGRALCGWACPTGLFLDMAGRFTGRRDPMPRWLAALKFVLLGATVASVLFVALVGLGTVLPFCSTICLGGILYGLIPYYATTARGGWAHLLPAGMALLAFHGAILFVYVLLARKYTARFFCRAICPMGAFLGLFHRISAVRVTHDPGACTDCGRCREACPMDIDLSRDDFLTRSNCIRCGACVNVCPHGARSWSVGPAGLAPAPESGRPATGH